MYINNQKYKHDISKILCPTFKAFKNKIFFITGASGLIGSFLIDTLMYLNIVEDYNIKIYATFTHLKSYEDRFISYINNKLLIPVVQDIINPIQNIDDVDYIIHTASNTHPLLYVTKPVETINLNIQGTLNVLNLAQQTQAKMIHLSTLEVYGEDKSVDSFKEDDIGLVNFNITRACYPESKRLAETLCHSYIQEYGTNINIARLGYIYGATVKLNSSKADVQFLNKALNNEAIVLKSDGQQKRSYCYVADVVNALLTILIKGKNSDVFNIASDSGNVKLLDFAKILADIAHVGLVFEVEGELEKLGGSKVTNSTLDNKKLKNIGWNSKFSLNEGILSTYSIKKELMNA